MKGSRRAVQRRIARAITAALLATAVVDASAEPEMTFKFSGRSLYRGSGVSKRDAAGAREVREWWGATFGA